VDIKSITLPAVARSIGVRKLPVKDSPVAWQWGEKPEPKKIKGGLSFGRDT
jgi:hypothetical protein